MTAALIVLYLLAGYLCAYQLTIDVRGPWRWWRLLLVVAGWPLLAVYCAAAQTVRTVRR